MDAIDRCAELPASVREATDRAPIEEHSFDQSYIEFLDTQILLDARGAQWTERLRTRRKNLRSFVGIKLFRASVQVGKTSYTIEVATITRTVIHWERYDSGDEL